MTKFSKTKVYKSLNILLKALILFCAYYFVYLELFKERKLADLMTIASQNIDKKSVVFLIIALFLVVVNWSVETYKWKFLISKLEKISFLKSFQAVLAGLTISIFTPNRVGEFFGRAFVLKRKNIPSGILMTVVGSYSQLLVSIGVGTIAFVYFVEITDVSLYLSAQLSLIIKIISITLFLFLLLLFFNVYKLDKLLKGKRWKKINNIFNIISLYRKRELAYVLLLSSFRYLVFSFQFYLIFLFLEFEINLLTSFLLTSVIYFVITAIPTIALAELGVRGTVSVAVFSLFYGNAFNETLALNVISTSSIIWLMNVIIPALLGSFPLVKLKYFK
jgi:uncharacterized membrane protein YbhN (UPF0104 family)